MSKPLDNLVREAREHLGSTEAKGVDWSSVEGELFARIDQERREEHARFTRSKPRWLRLAPGFVAAAAAAAVVFAFAHADERGAVASGGRGVEAVDGAEVGGRLAEIEGDARVLVDGRPAGQGTTLRLGDVIEVQRSGVIIERPGKLTLRIEGGSRAVVTRTDGALILALAQGAVEAQVVPVPSGEAFAVDVDGSRVAVHGTHLRVARSARAGARVTVDLNEGVIAIGNAPRVGSVVGSLVTAPAHAEFTPTDIAGSLSVQHDAGSVRPPVALGPSARAAQAALQAASVEHEAPTAAAAAPEFAPSPVAATVAAPPRPAGTAAHADVPPAAVGAEPASPPASEPAPSPPEPVADPEAALQAAVKECMDPRAHAENVTVVVSTTLHLELADDGSVRAARFEPPVAPDVNVCASPSIYRARFGHGGSATIRVDISN